MRAAGMRPTQIWVPDTRAPGFAEECQRQVRNLIDNETDESRAEANAWYALSATAWDSLDEPDASGGARRRSDRRTTGRLW